MNRIVAVPNWSFFAPDLAERAAESIAPAGVTLHYCKGDVDHQRTVIAYSGSEPDVFAATTILAHTILPNINLGIHQGVHPRIGAMDVLPFVLLEGSESDLIERCRHWSEQFSDEFGVPVHLYEKAAHDGREHRLPYLRGQMLGALEPLEVSRPIHTQWGISIIGVRDFLLATNIDIATPDLPSVKRVAKEIRVRRESGDPIFAGVRALGFQLGSRHMTQLSLNFTQPDETSFDDVFTASRDLLEEKNLEIAGTELIGVIRPQDLERASLLTVDPSQVVS